MNCLMFEDMNNNELQNIDGGGLIGAVVFGVFGAGVGLCMGAVRASVTGNSSQIVSTAVTYTVKSVIAGAVSPF